MKEKSSISFSLTSTLVKIAKETRRAREIDVSAQFQGTRKERTTRLIIRDTKKYKAENTYFVANITNQNAQQKNEAHTSQT